MGEYEIIKDEIDSFLDVYAYLKCQFYKKICVATVLNKITILNIAAQLLGGGGGILLTIGRS